MSNIRSVVCVHIPSFCASLEQIRKPELVKRPAMVTHVSANVEYVVSASKEARAQGVYEGMSARHAGRYCPDGVLVPADWEYYGSESNRFLDLLTCYSPLLEPQRPDGAYIDITGSMNLFGSLRQIVNEIHRRVQTEIGVRASIGIATNKLLAHTASLQGKAGGTMFVPAGGEARFLAPLPARMLPGIGEKIEKQLLNLGIRTVGELTSIPEAVLARQFGINGRKLHVLALGIDYSPVQAVYPPDRIFVCRSQDLMDGDLQPEIAESLLPQICEEMAEALKIRNQTSGKITLAMQFDGGKSSVDTCTPKSPVCSSYEVQSVASRLFHESICDAGIYSISLTAHDLQKKQGIQLSIFEDDDRKARLDSVLASITRRFGEDAMTKASLLKAG